MTDLHHLTEDELHAWRRSHREPADEVRYVRELMRRSSSKAALTRCGVPERWRAHGILEVEPHPQQRGTHTLLSEIRPGSRGLYLYGRVGTGKSRLTAALVVTLATEGVSARWLRWQQLLTNQRERMDGDRTATDLLDVARSCTVLVLDDLGAGKPTPWSVGIAEEVLDARLNSSLTTIITSNLWTAGDPRRVATLTGVMSARVTSRVAELCQPYRLDGTDLRVRG